MPSHLCSLRRGHSHEPCRRGGKRAAQTGAWPADAVRFELHGIIEEYVTAVTREWLLKVPDTNPAILEMFADRDKQPPRDLLPWSGEFAGKYLTGAV